MAGQAYPYKEQIHTVYIQCTYSVCMIHTVYIRPIAQKSGKLLYPASDLIVASLLLLIIPIILLG